MRLQYNLHLDNLRRGFSEAILGRTLAWVFIKPLSFDSLPLSLPGFFGALVLPAVTVVFLAVLVLPPSW